MVFHFGAVELGHGSGGRLLALVLDEAIAAVQAAAGVLQYRARVDLQADGSTKIVSA